MLERIRAPKVKRSRRELHREDERDKVASGVYPRNTGNQKLLDYSNMGQVMVTQETNDLHIPKPIDLILFLHMTHLFYLHAKKQNSY